MHERVRGLGPGFSCENILRNIPKQIFLELLWVTDSVMWMFRKAVTFWAVSYSK